MMKENISDELEDEALLRAAASHPRRISFKDEMGGEVATFLAKKHSLDTKRRHGSPVKINEANTHEDSHGHGILKRASIVPSEDEMIVPAPPTDPECLSHQKLRHKDEIELLRKREKDRHGKLLKETSDNIQEDDENEDEKAFFSLNTSHDRRISFKDEMGGDIAAFLDQKNNKNEDPVSGHKKQKRDASPGILKRASIVPDPDEMHVPAKPIARLSDEIHSQRFHHKDELEMLHKGQKDRHGRLLKAHGSSGSSSIGDVEAFLSVETGRGRRISFKDEMEGDLQDFLEKRKAQGSSGSNKSSRDESPASPRSRSPGVLRRDSSVPSPEEMYLPAKPSADPEEIHTQKIRHKDEIEMLRKGEKDRHGHVIKKDGSGRGSPNIPFIDDNDGFLAAETSRVRRISFKDEMEGDLQAFLSKRKSEQGGSGSSKSSRDVSPAIPTPPRPRSPGILKRDSIIPPKDEMVLPAPPRDPEKSHDKQKFRVKDELDLLHKGEIDKYGKPQKKNK